MAQQIEAYKIANGDNVSGYKGADLDNLVSEYHIQHQRVSESHP